MQLKEIAFLLPEIIVAAGSIFTLIFEPFSKEEERNRFPLVLVVAFLGAICVLLLLSMRAPVSVFKGTFIFDNFSLFLKVLILSGGVLVALLSIYSKDIVATRAGGEFASLLGFSVLGAMIAVSAGDFITMVIGIETLSMISYILAGFSRKSLSKEASLKYLIYGAFSTAIMLFGISIIYWALGTLFLKRIAIIISINPFKTLAFAGLIFTLSGFLFKVAAVPFHMWSPDVYQGAPTLVTAYLSYVPKVAGFGVIMRLLFDAFSRRTLGEAGWLISAGVDWRIIIEVVSALTMTVGNLSALLQRDLKRMLAYSSIAHAGYILMGVAAGNVFGNSGILYYLLAYFLMNVGAFVVVLGAEDAGRGTLLSAVKGLGWTYPVAGISMGVFLLSLTGIPPFAGFVGKVLLFGAVIKKGIYWLAVLGILNSVVSLGYYGIILKKMFLEEDEKKYSYPKAFSATALVLAVLTLFAGLFFNPLVKFATQGINSLGALL